MKQIKMKSTWVVGIRVLKKWVWCIQMGKKVQLMGFFLSDIMGIKYVIINGVEIEITFITDMDIIGLQTFQN